MVQELVTPIQRGILNCLAIEPGLSDRSLTDKILGKSAHPSQVNQACRLLAAQGVILRQARADGKLGNYLTDHVPIVEMGIAPESPPNPRGQRSVSVDLSEDDVKRYIVRWLEDAGWQVQVAWGKAHGIDIVGRRLKDAKWVIEVKGSGSRPEMRVNYFIGMLGETLQRMNDPDAKYSIAVPDLAQFRGLWNRLPELAKRRTGISALFVDASGSVDEAVGPI
jgi:hypothetical protein